MLTLNGTGYLHMSSGIFTGYPATILYFSGVGAMPQDFTEVWHGLDGTASLYAGAQNFGDVFLAADAFTGGARVASKSLSNGYNAVRLKAAVFVDSQNQLAYCGGNVEGVSTDGTARANHLNTHNRLVIGGIWNGTAFVPTTVGNIGEVHLVAGVVNDAIFNDVLAGLLLPDDIPGWIDGWTLKDFSAGGTYVSLGGTRTLTAVGGVVASAQTHPITRTVPTITGPSGVPGATSISINAAELQNQAGTWTATGANGNPSLTGTDALALAISAGGAVTLASGNFNFETKASYSFNVVFPTAGGPITQAVTLNITNVVEPPNAPTIGTATAGDQTITVPFTPGAAGTMPSVIDYSVTLSPSNTSRTVSGSPAVFTSADGIVNGFAQTATVRARNSDGFSTPSAASNSVTPAAAAVASNPPSAVSGTAVSGTTSTISWTPASTGGTADGFDVQYEAPLDSDNWVTATGATNPTGAGAVTFPVTGQTAGMQVRPRVRSIKTGFSPSAWTQGAPYYLDLVTGGGGTVEPVVPTAPTITTQPQGQTAVVGGTVTLSVVVTGSTPLSYQWRKNGTNISGATSSTYTTPALLIGDNGASFTVVVSNGVSPNATSNAAVVTVSAAPSAPTVTTQPTNRAVVENTTATFSAVFAGAPTPTYRWYRNGVSIVGAVGANYSLVPSLADTGATFFCRATNSSGSVDTNTVTLTVTAASVVPPSNGGEYVIYIPDTAGPRDTVNLSRSRGDDYGDEFIIKSAVTGLPIDLTGCSLVLTVDPNKAPETNASNLFRLTGTILDAVGGRVEFAPTALQSNVVGAFYFDIELTYSSGRKRTLKYGTYSFIQDISK